MPEKPGNFRQSKDLASGNRSEPGNFRAGVVEKKAEEAKECEDAAIVKKTAES